MRHAAGSGGGIVQRAGPLFGERKQLLDRFRRQLRRRQDDERRAADQHHRREVLDRVVGRPRLHRGRGGVRGRVREPHGVAVGLGTGDRLAAERGAGADAVVDDDLLAKPLREALAHDPGDDVGAAARLERNDQADRPFRRPPAVSGRLCMGRLRPRRARGEQSGNKSKRNLGHDLKSPEVRHPLVFNQEPCHAAGTRGATLTGSGRPRECFRSVTIATGTRARASGLPRSGATGRGSSGEPRGLSPPAGACCGWCRPDCG